MPVALNGAQQKMVAASKNKQTAFAQSWQAQGLGGYVKGQQARLRIYVQADPKFQLFLRRLDKMPAHTKRQFVRILRTAVREEVLPELKRQIPKSSKRKQHLRATAKVVSVNRERAIVTVGSSKLWYAAIVQAGRQGSKTGSVPAVPFFALTFKKVWHPLNRRLLRDLYDMMGWLEHGRQRKRF